MYLLRYGEDKKVYLQDKKAFLDGKNQENDKGPSSNTGTGRLLARSSLIKPDGRLCAIFLAFHDKISLENDIVLRGRR
jgi:hypothetical protein